MNQYAEKYSNIKVFDNKNSGFTNSLIFAISKSRGNYLAIQGAGDLSYSLRFQEQITALENNKNLVAVGSNFDVCDLSSNIVNKSSICSETSRQSLSIKVPFTHGTLMMRKSAYLASKGYDSRFLFCQDWDLYHRLIDLGSISCIDKTLYRKYLFSDGASIHPTKKSLQYFYSRVASRSNDWKDFFYVSKSGSLIPKRKRLLLFLLFLASARTAFVNKDYELCRLWIKSAFIKLLGVF